MTKAIDLMKIVGQREEGVLTVEVGNDLVNGWRELEEEWMVDEFDEAIER
jgi:hypothetical protein